MSKSFKVRFRGGKKIDAEFGGFSVNTDQSVKDGGEGSAPSPSEYFLVSIVTCAALYALAFCEKRGIDTGDLTLSMDVEHDEKTKMVRKLILRLGLPKGFPEKYQAAIVRAMDQCYVKKHLFTPPEFETVIG